MAAAEREVQLTVDGEGTGVRVFADAEKLLAMSEEVALSLADDLTRAVELRRARRAQAA